MKAIKPLILTAIILISFTNTTIGFILIFNDCIGVVSGGIVVVAGVILFIASVRELIKDTFRIER